MKYFLVSIFIGVILFFISFSYSLLEIEVESIHTFSESSVLNKNGNYYILIDNHELYLPSNYSNDLEMFNSYNTYNIKYVYNKFSPSEGTILFIEKYG